LAGLNSVALSSTYCDGGRPVFDSRTVLPEWHFMQSWYSAVMLVAGVLPLRKL
jgi:hypothetical protein